jgi:hypothetical protein
MELPPWMMAYEISAFLEDRSLTHQERKALCFQFDSSLDLSWVDRAEAL